MPSLRLIASLMLASVSTQALSEEKFFFRKVDGAGTAVNPVPPSSSGNTTPTQPSTPTLSLSASTLPLQEGGSGTVKATSNVPNPIWSLTGIPYGGAGSIAADGTVSVYAPDVEANSSFDLTVTATNPVTSAGMSVPLSLSVAPATASITNLAPVRSGNSFGAVASTSATYQGAWQTSASSSIAGLAFAPPGAASSALSGTAPANVGNASIVRTIAATFVGTAAPSGATPAMATGAASLTVYPELAFTGATASVTGFVNKAIPVTAPALRGQVGTMSYGLLAGGSDYAGTLPGTCPGLGFNAVAGTITGTPTGPCSVPSLSLRANDSGGPVPATSVVSNAFGLSVITPTVTVPAFASAIQEGDSATFTATTNMPNPTWGVTGGPAGSSVSSAGVVRLFGSDVTSDTAYSNIVLTASQDGTSVSATRAFTVRAASATVGSIAVRSLQSFVVPLTSTLAAGGVRWGAEGTPADVTALQFDQSSATSTNARGVAPANTGAAAITRTLAFTFHADQPAASVPVGGVPAEASGTGTLTVHPNLAFASSPPNLTAAPNVVIAANAPPTVNGRVGTLSYQLFSGSTDVSATFGTTAALCQGMTFSTVTGAIGNKAAAACSVPGLTYKATDPGAGSIASQTVQSASFALDVATPQMSIVQVSDRSVAAGSPFSLTPSTTNASGAVTWISATGLPSGLAMESTTTGAITGGIDATAASKAYPVTVSARDTTNVTRTMSFTITVTPRVAPPNGTSFAAFKTAVVNAGFTIVTQYCSGNACVANYPYADLMSVSSGRGAKPGHVAAFEPNCSTAPNNLPGNYCDMAPMLDSNSKLGGLISGQNTWGATKVSGGWDGIDFSAAPSGGGTWITYFDPNAGGGGSLYAIAIKKN